MKSLRVIPLLLLTIISILPTFLLASSIPTPTITPTLNLPTSLALPKDSTLPLGTESIPTTTITGLESIRTTAGFETIIGNTMITPAPTVREGELLQLQEKWHLTTYWSCVTINTRVDCGWHEPVLPGGTEIAGARCGSCYKGRGPMIAAVGAVAWGLL